MSHYQDRVNAGRLERQAPVVKRTAKEIFDALKDVERYLYWSLDPEEDAKSLDYNITNMIDQAHLLVDLGHAWRAVLAANPPPNDDDGD